MLHSPGCMHSLLKLLTKWASFLPPPMRRCDPCAKKTELFRNLVPELFHRTRYTLITGSVGWIGPWNPLSFTKISTDQAHLFAKSHGSICHYIKLCTQWFKQKALWLTGYMSIKQNTSQLACLCTLLQKVNATFVTLNSN